MAIRLSEERSSLRAARLKTCSRRQTISFEQSISLEFCIMSLVCI